MSELARRSVKVILSGVGGDELFGGYRRYLGDGLQRYYRLLPQAVRSRMLPALLARLPQDRHTSWKNYVRYAGAFVNSAELGPTGRYMSYVSVFSPALLGELLKANGTPQTASNNGAASTTLKNYFARCSSADSLNQIEYVDIKTSLADDLLALTDKMSMAASIECRAPFLDHELVELTSRIPSNLKVRGLEMKYLFKKVVKPWLPEEILRRKKRGFGAPMGAWLRNDLKALVQETLSETQVKRRGLFHWEVVQKVISSHDQQRGDHTDQDRKSVV